MRHSVATFAGMKSTPAHPCEEEDDDDEGLFVDVGNPSEGWVGVTDEAVDVPEVSRSSLLPKRHSEARGFRGAFEQKRQERRYSHAHH